MTFYLPLYSYRSKNVEARSGLNQGYADGRIRNLREVYIPIPQAFYTKMGTNPFPSRGTNFNLHLPNGDVLKASICQDNEKALMSNPNSDLGNWLVHDVLDIIHNRQITNEDLISAGIDSVKITTDGNFSDYFIKPAKASSFEDFMKK